MNNCGQWYWRASTPNGKGHQVSTNFIRRCDGVELLRHHTANRKKPYCKKCAKAAGVKP